MKLAERIARLDIESAFDVLVKARALEAKGRGIVHLEIGEPDFPTPPNIVDAAKQALDQGWTHYGPTQGLPELRESIAAYISRTRSISVSPRHVCVVPGAKPVLFFSMLALLEPGDEVLYPDPGFPIYRSMIRYLGATPVPVPLLEARGFSLDLNILRDKLSSRTRLLILNSPQNPTGGVIPAEDLREIAAMVRDRDLMVLSDEIYSRIFYTAEAPASIASLPGMLEKTILLDGFSKTYSMTGWRLGYGVMPEWLVEGVNKLMVNSNSCAASFTQRAALAALAGTADGRGGNGESIPATPRRFLPGVEHDSRLSLCSARRSLLCVCEYRRDRRLIKRCGRFPARARRRRLPERRFVRGAWRRLHSLQFRELAGKFAGGGPSHTSRMQ